MHDIPSSCIHHPHSCSCVFHSSAVETQSCHHIATHPPVSILVIKAHTSSRTSKHAYLGGIESSTGQYILFKLMPPARISPMRIHRSWKINHCTFNVWVIQTNKINTKFTPCFLQVSIVWMICSVDALLAISTLSTLGMVVSWPFFHICELRWCTRTPVRPQTWFSLIRKDLDKPCLVVLSKHNITSWNLIILNKIVPWTPHHTRVWWGTQLVPGVHHRLVSGTSTRRTYQWKQCSGSSSHYPYCTNSMYVCVG